MVLKDLFKYGDSSIEKAELVPNNKEVQQILVHSEFFNKEQNNDKYLALSSITVHKNEIRSNEELLTREVYLFGIKDEHTLYIIIE